MSYRRITWSQMHSFCSAPFLHRHLIVYAYALFFCISIFRTTRSADVDDLKRKVYYLAKDLLTAEKEISRLQKEISGVLQGVERDFR